MPIIAPNGKQHNGTDLRAFITNSTVGDIAIALGVAIAASEEVGSESQYVPSITPQDIDYVKVRAIEVQSAEIHYEFDRKLATTLSGRDSEDVRKVVMIGAGAIGSHVADCLIREGWFRWIIVDNDLLLPHNLARHIANKNDVKKDKASLVACHLSAILDDTEPVAHSICSNVITSDSGHSEIDKFLGEADIVIDATASIVAERYISDHDSEARRTCIFFNPRGDAAVLLAEPIDRSLTLRDLEAQYLSLVVRKKSLRNHLDSMTDTFLYTGACRAITNIIPQSRTITLSGLVAGGLTKAVDRESATIKIWSLRDSGEVKVIESVVSSVVRFEVAGWTVSIDQGLVDRVLNMRDDWLPKETGGVLTGIVDIPSKCIQLVDAAPAPADSVASESGFKRGMSGVQEYLELISEQTRGQVRYVGEWHSHPPRVPAVPSPTDLCQIECLAALFDMDSLPALMLIVSDLQINVILQNQCSNSAEMESATGAKFQKDRQK